MKKLLKPKSIFIFLGFIFMLINVIAYFHAYKFTHFDTQKITKTADAQHLSTFEKIKTVFFGVNNPRPNSEIKPQVPFQTIHLQSNKKIVGWYLPTDSAIGTVILFHGFSGMKAGMLDKATVFQKLKYNVFMIDFMGSGESEGNQTTVGFMEAQQVKTSVEFIKQKGENNIILFGTSMGAVAIMKAINDAKIQPSKIIIECPFGSMLETTQARFKKMHVPSFPMANLLVFWGGLQNGFNAYKHNPSEYAKNINCPTLLLYGEKDDKVSINETNTIYNNLKGKKLLKTFPNAGHENYLIKYENEWKSLVGEFLR